MRSKAWLVMVFIGVMVWGCTKQPEPKAESTDTAAAGQGLRVVDAHMFLPPPGQKTGAIYLRLHNDGREQRQLVDVSAEIAASAMVHRSYYAEGTMHMRHVHHLKLAPGETLAFQPSGYHIMLSDIAQVPEVGEHFKAQFGFDQGQTLAFEVEIRAQH